ncbi:nuclear transport factor 2 family protein [Mycobacterium vicinigordonae]|uniref:Nuclear transport factor 2 family protein n=1 Tax=Mycobacterium vicinigordonae TaxID=1719132 RepID=A0A7D6DY91_9MYCO|nr:nuclear transport factor 2 family protein [Mycobacterium vicinigordonae]QLL07408.1 nuclear transport factor 2 family protein [Mycobacterium vicinigordonae]
MERTAIAVATEFFERLSDNDLPGAMGLLSQDCAVWIASTSPGGAGDYAGTSVPKDSFAAMMARSQQLAARGMQFTIHRSLTDDDTAAIEVESRAELSDGRIYSNRYTFWLIVKDSRITGLSEYFDTKYAQDFFLGLLSGDKE